MYNLLVQEIINCYESLSLTVDTRPHSGFLAPWQGNMSLRAN